MAGVDSDNWYAISASSKVPGAKIERINQARRRTLTNEAVAAKLLVAGCRARAIHAGQAGGAAEK